MKYIVEAGDHSIEVDDTGNHVALTVVTFDSEGQTALLTAADVTEIQFALNRARTAVSKRVDLAAGRPLRDDEGSYE